VVGAPSLGSGADGAGRSTPYGVPGPQLLLLTGAAITVLPALLAASRPPWTVAALVGIGLYGLVGYAFARRDAGGHGTLSWRLWVGQPLVSLVALGIVLTVDGRDRPEAYLLLTAALVCGLGSLPSRTLRWASQAVTIAAMSLTLAGAQRGMGEQALMVLVLAAVAVISSAFVDELRSARRSMVASRRRAERRQDLLVAVQQLPTERVDAAAAARTLRALGYDAAGFAFVRGDRMVAEYVEGMADGPPPRRGEGLAWRCVREDRVVVTSDYQREPDRLESRQDVRTAVVVPLRMGGRPVGAIMCARRASSAPTETDIEVAEAVAAHLSGVLSALERERRQRELLERLHRLEAMRSGFVEAVSLELRAPLEAVGEASRALSSADRPSIGAPDTTLDELNHHALELGATIDAVLELSRFRSELGSESQVVLIELGEVLAPFCSTEGIRVELDPGVGALTVEVDPALLRRACELLGASVPRGMPPAPVVLRGRREGDEVELVISPPGAASALARALASHLLVAGGGTLQPDAPATIRIRVADPVALV
jgi:signal transduction histidine kinase